MTGRIFRFGIENCCPLLFSHRSNNFGLRRQRQKACAETKGRERGKEEPFVIRFRHLRGLPWSRSVNNYLFLPLDPSLHRELASAAENWRKAEVLMMMIPAEKTTNSSPSCNKDLQSLLSARVASRCSSISGLSISVQTFAYIGIRLAQRDSKNSRRSGETFDKGIEQRMEVCSDDITFFSHFISVRIAKSLSKQKREREGEKFSCFTNFFFLLG